MSSLKQKFLKQIVFDAAKTGMVGVEREVFLRPIYGGCVVPAAASVYRMLLQEEIFPDCFTYELSACQIESRTDPVFLAQLEAQLVEREIYLQQVLNNLGLKPDFNEVAEVDMTTEVYPDKRYLELRKELPPEVLLAACRVIGTHVHVGMPDLETAIRVYNYVIGYTDDLIELGDGSEGERMRLYRIVSPQCDPVPIYSAEHLFEIALQQNFNKNLRNWWSLIRITRYGTIEFRLFGSTASAKQIVSWAQRCHGLCMEAI